MQTFLQYHYPHLFRKYNRLISEEKNVHMTHLEDLVFDGGVDGTRQAINTLRSLRDTLGGSSDKKLDISVKWDGCLDKDTKVITAHGPTAISEIVAQPDKYQHVWGYNEQLKADQYARLLNQVSKTGDKKWVTVKFVDRKDELTLTEDHQVAVLNDSGFDWIAANRLRPGDSIKLSATSAVSDNVYRPVHQYIPAKPVIVDSVQQLETKREQYDITTSTENFYVLIDQKKILVHNSPAVFFGIDPSDGQFFVAKKSLFNKEPKVYKTPGDIDDDIDSADLNNKMQIALMHLSKLGVKKDVYQGDIMFTKADLKKKKIDGEQYIVFQPNTIAYAVPVGSQLAHTIQQAEIGVALHTFYSGVDLQSLSASYKVDLSQFRQVDSVWLEDAMLRDLAGTATLTKKQTDQLSTVLTSAGKLFRQVPKDLLSRISEKPINMLINVFNNRLVRDRNRVSNFDKHTQDFKQFLWDRYNNDIDKLKSDRGKQRKTEERDAVMSIFTQFKSKDIANMFRLHATIATAKEVVINKLNEINGLNTFVQTTDGYQVTGNEGFVAIDHLGGAALKLVDRYQFSYHNFSPDIIKGFDKVRA